MKRKCCDGRCPPCVDRERNRLLRALGPLVAAVALAIWGCAPPHPAGATVKERFDAWFANSSGAHVVHAPVPCQRDPYLQCNAPGGYEIDTKTVYLDDAAIAKAQATQNTIDPSKNVALQVEYHEKSHAAFFITNDHLNNSPQDPGTAAIWFEREAQCGMRLLVGGWSPPGTNPDIYWICPDFQLDRTNLIWYSHGVI
jgi:hypothetical protein